LLTERLALLLGDSFEFFSRNSACMCYYYYEGKAGPKTLQSRDTKVGENPTKTQKVTKLGTCEDSAFYHKTPKQKSQRNLFASLTAFYGLCMYLITIVWPLLQSNVSALIDMKLEKYKNIREESAFFWGEISEGTLKFDRKQEEVCTH